MIIEFHLSIQHRIALTRGKELQIFIWRQLYARWCLEGLDPQRALSHTLCMYIAPQTQNITRQAWLFSALDHEVSRGPIDFRRDWTDEDDVQPRWATFTGLVYV